MHKRKRHAIIIGAGVAGLTAAYYLLTMTDIKPIVLEKENFVGGLARTINFNGNRMDIGGRRFFTKDKNILALWQKFFSAQGDEVSFNCNLVSKIFYRQKFFPYPVPLNLDTIKNLGLGEMFSIGMSFLQAKFKAREENTFEDFLINRFGRRFYEIFFRDYVTKVWGRPPQEIGVSLGIRQVRASSFSDKFFYPKFGSGQLWEKFAEEIKKLGGEVLFESNVKSFRVDGNKIIKSVSVESPAGKLTFPADYYLSSMPLAELAEALDDGLNFRQLQIARGLPYRDLIIVGLLVDKLAFGDQNQIKMLGDIHIQESAVKLGRLQIFNNRSDMVADPQNTVWLGLEYFCNEGDELWQMGETDFINFATEELASIGIIDKAAVRAGLQVKVPKAYPAYFDTYENISELRGALDEIQNLYCIGRNGHHRLNNMDHSMLTALAAVCAVAGQFPKSDIWKINADAD